MTLLQLVNKVLEKLREDSVEGLTADYPSMIAGFVNEAKEDIEDMGPWYALRTTLTGSLTQDVATLDLTSSTNDRSYLVFSKNLPMAFITTASEERRLQVVEAAEIEALQALDPDAQHDVPAAVAFRRSDDGIEALFFPTPDQAYTYQFSMVVPQDDLDDMDDELTIPGGPVWRTALFYALDERGEDFAGSAARAEQRARQAVGDAILRDFGKDEMTFEAA